MYHVLGLVDLLWVEMTNFFLIAQGTLPWQPILWPNWQNWPIIPSFIALVFTMLMSAIRAMMAHIHQVKIL